MTDRIAGTLIMGLDVAVEFATLGEFRIVGSELGSAPIPLDANPAPLMLRPARASAPAPDPRLLPAPSTALARANRAADSAARDALEPPPIRLRMPPRSTLRPVMPPARRRTRPATPIRPSPKVSARSRAGAVKPGTQLCLFGR